MGDWEGIPAVVKWGKQRYDVLLRPGSSSDALKEEMFLFTGVPPGRQRMMCPGAWKGMLKAGAVLDETLALAAGQTEFSIMLVGTAEKMEEAEKTIVFAEDLKETGGNAEMKGDEIDACNIIALQKIPRARDDRKVEWYRYSHFVLGQPQRQIEDYIRRQREQVLQGERGPRLLRDCCVAQFGVELGASYISVLAVLSDGTLVSGMENGKIQLWRHCERLREVVHGPDAISCVTTLQGCHGVAFATGAAGSVKFWSSEGDCLKTFMAFYGTTPTCLVALCSPAYNCLAVVFRQARPFDPNAFRLVPANEEQRRRRAEAEAAQVQAQAAFDLHSSQVQILELSERGDIRLTFLGPIDSLGSFVTSLAVMGCDGIVAGNAQGGLHLWSLGNSAVGNSVLEWKFTKALQLWPNVANVGDGGVGSGGVSVVCMQALAVNSNVLAVSVEATSSAHNGAGSGVARAYIPTHGVVLIDMATCVVLAVLTAHTDVVRCMCAMPDGGLVTGGGKRDATVRTWHPSQWHASKERLPSETAPGLSFDSNLAHLNIDSARTDAQQGESAREGEATVEDPAGTVAYQQGVVPKLVQGAVQTLRELGYVFALTILADEKQGSQVFALAGARYNTVKICL